MMSGASAVIAVGVLADSIFCEKCNKWIKNKKTRSNLEPIKNLDAKILQFQKGNFADLSNLKKVKENLYTEIELAHCHLCKEQYFLTVKLVGTSIDKDGKEKKKESDIAKHAAIGVSTYNHLSKLEK